MGSMTTPNEHLIEIGRMVSLATWSTLMLRTEGIAEGPELNAIRDQNAQAIGEAFVEALADAGKVIADWPA